MSRDEFLRGLEEALAGEVPASVIQDNLNYYASYLSQEMAKGRTVDEIAEEIGGPRIVAQTIIDSCEAGGEAGTGYGTYEDAPGGDGYQRENPYAERNEPNIHYFDLSKWYWKLIFAVVAIFFLMTVFGIVGGIFSLLFQFAGPILVALLLYWIIKNLRR